jgi:hypothetical protein
MRISAILLEPQMILNQNINYKVIVLIEIYNFAFGHFATQGYQQI